MDPHDAAPDEPAEHLRFAAWLRDLEQVADADEAALVGAVLRDPDRVMAESAVVRHLDRRAGDLHLGPAWEPWAESMARATTGRPFLARRLREWALLRAIALRRPWCSDALLAASDWLQRKAAATPNATALEILAEHGRTRRIRNAARTGLRESAHRTVPRPAPGSLSEGGTGD
ncbi:hypothetical protein [Actinacidiphila acididurans]|uniref:DUF222 domain-containing protein n=1 Tax=Actinacidiphila acididurans TaxID=2784346 RepID=A0ABS2TW68_9ACTN|nr:hypothetical protein [Actinacidiphila acididurans]MBM9507585.1 hypothetical protein [Actinacidiphila acididurans]